MSHRVIESCIVESSGKLYFYTALKARSFWRNKERTAIQRTWTEQALDSGIS